MKVCLLGASGSVGGSTLKVIRLFKDKFCLHSFSVHNNVQKAKEIIEEFSPEYLVISSDEVDRKLINDRYKNTTIYYGAKYLSEIVKDTDVDIVVTAVVGSVGILPTIEAIQHNKKICLANKETLVTFGPYINELSKKHSALIVPVDSEHNSLFQLLDKKSKDSIQNIYLTASGGAFRDLPIGEFKNITLNQALHHPVWKMGPKITIDSAGMVNKGLEVIEAHYLFHIDFDRIRVVIHPESIVHGIIEMKDGSTFLYASHPDMIYPVAHSLFYPEINFDQLIDRKPATWKSLHFSEPEEKRYPALNLAYHVGRAGGIMPAVYNAANEAAVELFINEQIHFTQIPELIDCAVQSIENSKSNQLEDFLDADKRAREIVKRKVI